MAAIGIALLWGAYGLGLQGYALIRGYDMAPGSFWNPVHPGQWNTKVYTGPGIFPDGKTQGAASSSSNSTGQGTKSAAGTGAGGNPTESRL
jgi:hypothetical protein